MKETIESVTIEKKFNPSDSDDDNIKFHLIFRPTVNTGKLKSDHIVFNISQHMQ